MEIGLYFTDDPWLAETGAEWREGKSDSVDGKVMRSVGSGLVMAVPYGLKFSGVNGTASIGLVGEETRRGGDIMRVKRKSNDRDMTPFTSLEYQLSTRVVSSYKHCIDNTREMPSRRLPKPKFYRSHEERNITTSKSCASIDELVSGVYIHKSKISFHMIPAIHRHPDEDTRSQACFFDLLCSNNGFHLFGSCYHCVPFHTKKSRGDGLFLYSSSYTKVMCTL